MLGTESSSQGFFICQQNPTCFPLLASPQPLCPRHPHPRPSQSQHGPAAQEGRQTPSHPRASLHQAHPGPGCGHFSPNSGCYGKRGQGLGTPLHPAPQPCQQLGPACNALATLTLLAMPGKDHRGWVLPAEMEDKGSHLEA